MSQPKEPPMTANSRKRYRRYGLSIIGDGGPRSWELSEPQLRALEGCFEEGIIMLEGNERSLALGAMELVRAAMRYGGVDTVRAARITRIAGDLEAYALNEGGFSAETRKAITDDAHFLRGLLSECHS